MRFALVAMLLTALGCYAQEPTATPATPAPKSQPQEAISSEQPMVTVPAGTRVLLFLVRPVSTRTTKAGDKVYLQTSAPVVVGDKLAIPTGTSVEGTLDKTARARWAKRRAEIHLRFASLVFPNGYTVSIPGSLDLTINLRESSSTYGDAGAAAPLAALGATGGGMAIGALAHGARGTAVGGMIGGAAGTVIAIALFLHHGGVFMDVGTPVDMVLESLLTVEQERVLKAARQYTPRPISPPHPIQRWCYDPGAIATPGTPDMTTAGTPPTPSRYFPCPTR